MKAKFTFLFLWISSLALAQNNCTSQRYISEVFSSYNLNSSIYYGAADPYGIVSNQNLYLDIYEPAGDTLAKRPVIVHKFGGGYAIGWRSEPNIPDFAEMYTKRGFVFVSIDYRLGFNVLSGASAERAVYRGILDLRSALRFLVDNAAQYGIDTSAIFLTGTSAGCVSALGQTFMDEGDRPSSTFGTLLEPADLGCVNCSGNNNFNNQEVKIHGIINNWGAILDTALIDITDDATDSVPVISFHGTNDNAVKYVEGNPFSLPQFPSLQGSFLIHKRLASQNIKNKLFPLVGFGHEPQLLNPDLADTIVLHASQFLYEILQGEKNIIVGDSTVCLNDTTSYQIALDTNSSYCWEVLGGDLILQNNHTAKVYWHTTGNHTLKVTELTELEVSKTSELNIQVAAPISATINYSSYDGLFQFYSNIIPDASYFWDFGDGITGNTDSVNHQYIDTSSYTVTLEINNAFCTAKDSVYIKSDLCPTANFTATTNDSLIFLNNTASHYNTIYWNFGDGNYSHTDTNLHQYNQEGNYTITQIVSNNYCTDTFSQNIDIAFCAVADFSFLQNNYAVDFTNNSINTQASFWNFGDGSTSGLFEPTHTYADTGFYNIELIVYSNSLCSDTLKKEIYIEEKSEDTSAVISIQNIVSEDITFYPSPAQNKLYVQCKNKDITQLMIYSSLGEKIKHLFIKSKKTIEIDLRNIPNGNYFILLAGKDNFYKSKFSIQK